MSDQLSGSAIQKTLNQVGEKSANIMQTIRTWMGSTFGSERPPVDGGGRRLFGLIPAGSNNNTRAAVQMQPEIEGPSMKEQILVKLLVTTFGLAVSLGVTYVAFKLFSDILDPTSKEKNEARKRAKMMLARVGVSDQIQLTDYELCIAANLVDPVDLTTSWEDIGGLEDIIRELRESVILPFRRADLFSGSALYQAPRGVLLHGAPGCGKTMIARAMARAAGARFINLQVSTLFDKWYGESQKRAEAIFTLAIKLQPSIIFIDEIDSFLRSRDFNDHESTSMMKTQFMTFWDGLTTDHKAKVMIVGATNRPQDVDPAIMRRMPTQVHVGLPSRTQREQILRVILIQERVSASVLTSVPELALRTEGWSGSDLKELCREATVNRVRDILAQENFDEDESFTEEALHLTGADFERAFSKLMKGRRPHLPFTPLDTIVLD